MKKRKVELVFPPPPELEITIEGYTPVEKIIWCVLFVLICLGIITVIVGYITI